MAKMVLVVDDSLWVRERLRNLFDSAESFEVCGEAGNGREGVEKAEQLQPDLIILDLYYACDERNRRGPEFAPDPAFSPSNSVQLLQRGLSKGRGKISGDFCAGLEGRGSGPNLWGRRGACSMRPSNDLRRCTHITLGGAISPDVDFEHVTIIESTG